MVAFNHLSRWGTRIAHGTERHRSRPRTSDLAGFIQTGGKNFEGIQVCGNGRDLAFWAVCLRKLERGNTVPTQPVDINAQPSCIPDSYSNAHSYTNTRRAPEEHQRKLDRTCWRYAPTHQQRRDNSDYQSQWDHAQRHVPIGHLCTDSGSDRRSGHGDHDKA